MMPISVKLLSEDSYSDLCTLFDAYRQFYGQDPDLPTSSNFIRNRMSDGDSVVFVAFDDGEAVGFTQLYPSYSSVSVRRLWVLNDLYVAPHARRRGVARHLIDSAKAHAQSTGAVRLSLATAPDNHQAQALYDSMGFDKDDFVHYDFSF